MQEGRGPEDKLMANTATELISQWLRGLKLVDEVVQRSVLSEKSRKEFQRLVPFMVMSFQIASEMIQKVTFSDQAFLDRVFSSGLGLPLRFLLPFGDTVATWQLKCTLQAARLLFSQKGKQTQGRATAAGAPPAHFLAPCHNVCLSILQTAAAFYIGESDLCVSLAKTHCFSLCFSLM